MTTDELLIRLALINLATVGPLLLIGLLCLYWRLLRSSGRRAEVTRAQLQAQRETLADHVTAEVGARTAEVRLLVVTESQKTASAIGDAIVEQSKQVTEKVAELAEKAKPAPRPRATPRTRATAPKFAVVPDVADAPKAPADKPAPVPMKQTRKRSSK